MNKTPYHRSVAHLKEIDAYRLQQLFGIPEGPIFHAFKKLLASGERGAKSRDQDIQESIDSLKRWQEMQREDEWSLTVATAKDCKVEEPVCTECGDTAEEATFTGRSGLLCAHCNPHFYPF